MSSDDSGRESSLETMDNLWFEAKDVPFEAERNNIVATPKKLLLCMSRSRDSSTTWNGIYEYDAETNCYSPFFEYEKTMSFSSNCVAISPDYKILFITSPSQNCIYSLNLSTMNTTKQNVSNVKTLHSTVTTDENTLLIIGGYGSMSIKRINMKTQTQQSVRIRGLTEQIILPDSLYDKNTEQVYMFGGLNRFGQRNEGYKHIWEFDASKPQTIETNIDPKQ
eukprot:130041_1